MFIRVVYADGTPNLLNLDEVERITQIDGIPVVVYKGKDKNGTNWEADLKTPFEVVEQRQVEAGVLAPKQPK